MAALAVVLVSVWTPASPAAAQSPHLERLVDCTDRNGPLRGRLNMAASGDHVLVGDWDGSRVYVFSTYGDLVADWEISGVGSTRSRSAPALAGDRQGHVYVLDRDAIRIDEFARDGLSSRPYEAIFDWHRPCCGGRDVRERQWPRYLPGARK
jgi:hypothetical protein